MRFIPDVESERYDRFVAAHPTKSHFMQSSAWGELNRRTRGMTPYLTGLEDESGQLVAAALLLLRKPPLFPPYIYSPRGFVVDFDNRELLETMTREVGNFARSLGAMFVKIDPDLEIHQLDPHGQPLPGAPDRSQVVQQLKDLGFRHRGFNLGFEGRQPRFTFRIDLQKPEKELEKQLTGNVMKNIRKGQRNYPAEILPGGEQDVGELHRLIQLTSLRDGFFCYGEEYYREFYRTLAEKGMARLWLGRVDPGEVLASLRRQLQDTETALASYKKEHHIKEAQLTIQRLHREIESFEGYAKLYPGPTTISAHLVVRFGPHAWAVHAGSAGVMNETFLNNRVYWHKILHERQTGAVWLDQFGTIGNPDTGSLSSLHQFKQQFGGRYVEFPGEFDLPLRPLWYRLYQDLLPRYRRLRFSIKEWLRGHGSGRQS